MSYYDENLGFDRDITRALLEEDEYGCSECELGWKCKDGNIIAINSMSSRHIKNCIAMIKRSVRLGTPWRTEYLEPLMDILRKRAFERAIKHLSEDELLKIINRVK